MTREIYIGEHKVPCVIGLDWSDERDKKGACCESHIDKKKIQYGFPSEQDDSVNFIGKNSLAIWCAETFSTGVTVASFQDGDDIKYWMCATSERIILTETDRLYDTMEDLEDAIFDAMDVVSKDSIHQLCHAAIEIPGVKVVFYDLNLESFSDSMAFKAHGMSGKTKSFFAFGLLVVIAISGVAYYLYDKHQKELALEQTLAVAVLAQQMLVDQRDSKLSHKNPFLAGPIIKEMRNLPAYLAGWKIVDASWDAASFELVVNYTRVDGTIEFFKLAVFKYADSISMLLDDTDKVQFTKSVPLKGYVEGDLASFSDIKDDLVSLLQTLKNRGVEMTNTLGFVSAVTPSLSWEVKTKHPLLALNSLSNYGFVLSKIEWKTSGEWMLNGEFYAK